MSAYQDVDKTLLPWARAQGLHVNTSYRDDEVRSMAVVDPSGRECQLFLTVPSDGGVLHVIAVAGSKELARIRTRSEDLVPALDRAHRAIQAWFENQNARK